MESLDIVLQNDELDVDTVLFGDAIFEVLDELDEIAIQIGMKQLSSFIGSVPPGEEDSDEPVGEFFPAEEGWITVRALSAKLASDPACVPYYDDVMEDLSDCEKILAAARAAGVGWRFEVVDWEEGDLEEEFDE